MPALPNDTSSTQSRRRVSNLLGAFSYLAPQGFSNYNALLSTLKSASPRAELPCQLHLVARARCSSPITEGINGQAIQDPTNLAREYGPLEFDIMRRFVTSYFYELPFGRGKRFLNGSSRAWIFCWEAGRLTGSPRFRAASVDTRSFVLGKTDVVSRPNLIGDPTDSARQPHNWLNPAAFSIPTNAEIVAGNFYGNQGVVRSPGMVNLISRFSNFEVREGMRVQFRTELFNAMNTPYLSGGVGLTVGTPTFGRVSVGWRSSCDSIWSEAHILMRRLFSLSRFAYPWAIRVSPVHSDPVLHGPERSRTRKGPRDDQTG